jgi:hypothetical protein
MTLAFLQSPIRSASGPLACLLLATLVGLANAETPTRLDAIVGAGVLIFPIIHFSHKMSKRRKIRACSP